MKSLNLERASARLELLSRTYHPTNRVPQLREIIRLLQDQYDYELHQLESLNVVHADPALTAAHGEPVV